MNPKSIHLEIPPSSYFIQPVQSISEGAMIYAGAGKIDQDSKTYNFVLAVEEIIMNILKHGTKNLPKNSCIQITYLIYPEYVIAKIVDQGLPYKTPSEYDERTVIEHYSGMGLHFVRSLMDDYQYQYNKKNKTNNVTLMIKLIKKELQGTGTEK